MTGMLRSTLKQLPFRHNKRISYASALFASIAITAIQSNPATAAIAQLTQPYDLFGSYSAINPINGDPTDIYFPLIESSVGDRVPVDDLPIALLLQGALVDKEFYSDYASQVARYGFAVAVPNHTQTIPGFGEVLAPETSQVQNILAQFEAETNSASSPLSGKVDTQKLGLLGHSFGGAVGLSSIGEICLPGFCPEAFERPEALKGGAFFGANLRDQQDVFFPIDNEGIGIALIQGNQDGRALPVNAERTF